ncbi:MAG: peptide-methionine (R)-S-oxide reductase MsrB [Candidatus Kerfeldbacteria bacterium]|nr:peptide-methionine (R)-S-oxide reductase MsrB [Candidatus Kerfeldbacteria bacterium]
MPKNDEEWKQKLTPEQYAVLREKGTEPAFTGKYFDAHEHGMYMCAGCGAQLFSSDHKFDSGTGWPSYDRALPGAVEMREDTSHGMRRTEVVCAKCGGHLGHLFDDGPSETTGKRFCINSCALDLKQG